MDQLNTNYLGVALRGIEDFVNLPDDPEDALIAFCAKMDSQLEEVRDENNWEAERDYVDAIQAFEEVYRPGYVSLETPPISNNNFADFFYQFKRQLSKSLLKLALERARSLQGGANNLIVLDGPSRQKIRALIDTIKEKLDELELPEERRESLFAKLNAFLAELDRSRTRTAAFNAFVVEIARGLGTASEKVKPLWERIDRVLDWLDKAAKWSDTLPPWSERKQLEAPKKSLPSPDDKQE